MKKRIIDFNTSYLKTNFINYTCIRHYAWRCWCLATKCAMPFTGPSLNGSLWRFRLDSIRCFGCSLWFHVACASTDCSPYLCRYCEGYEDDILPDLPETLLADTCYCSKPIHMGYTQKTPEDILSECLSKFEIKQHCEFEYDMVKAFNFINDLCIPDFSAKLPPVRFHWFDGEKDRAVGVFLDIEGVRGTNICLSTSEFANKTEMVLTLMHEMGHALESSFSHDVKTRTGAGPHGSHFRRCTTYLMNSVIWREHHFYACTLLKLNLSRNKSHILKASI